MYYDEARNTKNFNLSIKELANVIKANDYTLQHNAKIRWRTFDPRFASPEDGEDFPEMFRLLMAAGVTGWVKAPFDKQSTGREKLKALINYNPALPMIGVNQPRWYVRKGLRNSNRMYQRHCYDEKKDKEDETYKDFLDCDKLFLGVMGDEVRYEDLRESRHYGSIAGTSDHVGEILYRSTAGMA
jgi:hypothetical protein